MLDFQNCNIFLTNFFHSNQKVTNLKIQSNPFARGFRGDWRKTKAKRNTKKGGTGLNSSTTSTSYEDCMGGDEGDEEGDDENYAHHHHVSGDTILNSEEDENDEQMQEQSTSTSFDDKENESILSHSRFLDNGTVTIKVEPEY